MFEEAVIRQHILPNRSIERFCSGDPPKVEVLLLKHGKLLSLDSKSGPFYATRKWDEGIERAAYKFETDFQILADRICQDLMVLDETHWRTINNFYAILGERSRARYVALPTESRLENLSPGSSKPKKELDDLERDSIFLSGDPAQANRGVIGFAQRLALGAAQRSNAPWGIARSAEREFLVSDCFHLTARIPLSPRIYLERRPLSLEKTQHSRQLTGNQVVAFNQDVFNEAEESVFARKFAKAGLLVDQRPAKP